MTTPTGTGDPRWTNLCEQIALIADPNDRDRAGDALTEAYSLGVETGVKRPTGDPHTGQSEATASGTRSTLPPEQTQPAPLDGGETPIPYRTYQDAIDVLRDDRRYEHWWTKTTETHPEYGYWQKGRRELADYLETVKRLDDADALAPKEPLPPPCGLPWRDDLRCPNNDGWHDCVLIGGHRTHRCVCSAYNGPDDVEAGKPDATEQLFADFTTEWLAAGDDAERTEALEDLLDGWYTNWPATAVTSAHWPIADRLVSMLGPWNGITLTDPTDDLWLIVAEVLAKGGLDAAMWEDDAREILRRLGLPKVKAAVPESLVDAIATAGSVRAIHRLRHDLATAEERIAGQARIISGQVSLIANVWALTAAKTDHDVVSVELLRKALRDGPATDPEPEDLTDDELDVACAIEYLVRHGQPLNARGVRRLQGERDLARQSAEREATNAEQLRQHFDKASRERDTWKSNAEHWENNRNGWHLRALRAEAERDEARRVRDAEQLASRRLRDDAVRLRRRIAALVAVQPTEAEYGAAIAAAWPGLPIGMAPDEARRRIIAAVDAAWKLNGAPHAEDTEPAQAGQDAPDWTSNLYGRIGKQAPVQWKPATPSAPAAGTNGCTEGC